MNSMIIIMATIKNRTNTKINNSNQNSRTTKNNSKKETL